MQEKADVTWKFYRMGGLDQVTLRTAGELEHLRELDPKLWVALSSPASGLEFDARTLALIDTDQDGRIRLPEVVAAVEWACARLADPASLASPAAAMSLSRINTATEEGGHLLASARALLENLGKAGADSLTQDDVTKVVATAAGTLFNGDGVLPAHASLEPDVREFIRDALAVMGGVMDAGGEPGINNAIATAFVGTLNDRQAWKKSVSGATGPLGPDTAEAWDLFQRLKGKIDDYFTRAALAAFAPGATAALNGDEKLAAPDEGCLRLEADVLEALPLSRVEGDTPLDLTHGLNPAWREAVERFAVLIAPLLGQNGRLNREEWKAVQGNFAPYEEALARKPGLKPVDVAIAPTASVDSLGEDRIASILTSDVASRFAVQAEKDASSPGDAAGIAAVERLVCYYFHLHRLLMNFVSFYDFYSLSRKATFQYGILYLDGRACTLCLPVNDVEKHAALAASSRLCLVYCQCRRKDAPGSDEETMTIAAAVTAGNADLLLAGRNGVFVDNRGRDWDATVVKVISNPISLREAMWDPYRRFGRMVTEQITKLAASRRDAVTATAEKKIETASTPPAATPAPGPAPFDIGKSVGIFAAIGLALGALGTALASIAAALFSLSWWQFPLLFLGIFLLISGPSVVLAWFKLRGRTLGPLLEASGWATNARAPINLYLGGKLTDTAKLPPNAERSARDPLHVTRHWPWVVLLAALCLCLAGAWFWFHPIKPGFLPFQRNATVIQQGTAKNATTPLRQAQTNATGAGHSTR